jgi:DNA polymerase-3 subunit delta
MEIFDIKKIKTLTDFPPILLLYGKDSFSLNEYYKRIIDFLVPNDESRLDFEMIDGDESDINNMVTLALQLPMLSDRRIVVVRRFDSMFLSRRKKVTTASSFHKYLSNPNPTTILILLVEDTDTSSKNKVDFTKDPFSILLSKHSYKEFPYIKENKYTSWVIDRFKQKSITIEQRTAELIVSNTQPSLMDLANEIDKICLYYIDKNNISFDEITDIIGYTRANTIFDLEDAMQSRNIKRAISILQYLMQKNGEETIIIYTLGNLFYKLYRLIELKKKNIIEKDIAKDLGVHPYFLNNYIKSLRNYNIEEISKAIMLINDVDYKLKSMKINKHLLVEELLINILEK